MVIICNTPVAEQEKNYVFIYGFIYDLREMKAHEGIDALSDVYFFLLLTQIAFCFLQALV